MSTQVEQIITAECEDLLLAKNCAADLASFGICEHVSITELDTGEVLDKGPAYGNAGGGLAGRGMIFGAVLGLVVGVTLWSLFGFQVAYAWALPSILLIGVALGGFLSMRQLQAKTHSGHRRKLRFVVQFSGTRDEITAARRILEGSSCRNLRIHEATGVRVHAGQNVTTVA